MVRRPGLLSLLFTLLCSPSYLLAQDNEDPLWSASVGARYLNRYMAYGIDLGNEQSASGFSLGLDHASGFSAGIGGIRTLGNPAEWQSWFASAGYAWEASEGLTLSAELTHYIYGTDSANVLASLTNSIGLGADFDLGRVSLGLSYDAYLGNNSASYFSLDASTYFKSGDLSILPLVQVTLMSQEIENRLLKSSKGSSGGGRGGSTGSSSTSSRATLTGLSSASLHVVLVYRLFDGLNASFHPYYLYAPKSELNTRDSNLIWTAGIRYSIEF